MLRLLILIECDQCQETLTAVPSSSHGLGIAWDVEIENQQYLAEQSGWSVYRSQHICNVCVMECMTEQNHQ